MTSAWEDDPGVARLLAAAAVAGPRFRLVVMAKVLGLDPGDCVVAVDRAVRAGVLVIAPDAGEGWYADEGARRVAEGSLTLAERVGLHRRFAEVLESEPGPDHGQIAQHLTAASAATLDPVDRARLQIRLAGNSLAAGELLTARAAVRAAVAVARRSGSAQLLADAASTLEPLGESSWDGDVYQWCAEALAAAGLDDHTRVRLLARQAQAAVYCGHWTEALELSDEALRGAEVLGDRSLVIDALTARQLATSGPDDIEELVRLADRMADLGTSTGRADVEMWGCLWRIDALGFVGDLTAIEAETTRLASCVGRIDDSSSRWHLLGAQAALALARAEFARAERLQGEAVELLEQIGHPAVHGASVSFQVWLGHHVGHSEEILEPEVWEFGTDPRWALGARLFRAFVLVDCGRTEEAAVQYQRCGAPQGWDIARWGVLPVWAIAARVAAALGADNDARYLCGRLEPHRGRYVVGGGGATRYLGPVELTLGACASALGDWTAARQDLRRAGTLCREAGMPGLRVEADCLLAEALDASGDPVAARAVAREAISIARTLGMPPWTRRLEQFAVPNPLSPRERQIAALVADGLSNREIAARLVISERTAQNHVQHILGKLGFGNRALIAAWIERNRSR